MIQFREFIKGIGTLEDAAKPLGVSSRTLTRYAAGDLPKPLDRWLASRLGRDAIRSLLAEYEIESEKPAS